MRALALVLALALTPGCATVLGGGRTDLVATVESPPPNVAIRIHGLENADRDVAYAPTARMALERTSSYLVIAEAPGYAAAQKLIGRRLSGWLLLDFLLAVPFVVAGWPLSVRPFPGGPDLLSVAGGGVALGALAIDFTTGAAWTHTDDRVRLRLTKASPRP